MKITKFGKGKKGKKLQKELIILAKKYPNTPMLWMWNLRIETGETLDLSEAPDLYAYIGKNCFVYKLEDYRLED